MKAPKRQRSPDIGRAFDWEIGCSQQSSNKTKTGTSEGLGEMRMKTTDTSYYSVPKDGPVDCDVGLPID